MKLTNVTDELHPWYGKQVDPSGFRVYDGYGPGNHYHETKREYQSAKAAWRRAQAANAPQLAHVSVTSAYLKEAEELFWLWRAELDPGPVRDRIDKFGAVTVKLRKAAQEREAEAAKRMEHARAHKTNKRKSSAYLLVTLPDNTSYRVFGYDEAAKLLGRRNGKALMTQMSQQGGLKCVVGKGDNIYAIEKLDADGTPQHMTIGMDHAT